MEVLGWPRPVRAQLGHGLAVPGWNRGSSAAVMKAILTVVLLVEVCLGVEKCKFSFI